MAAVPDLCYNPQMSQTHRKSITEEQWDEAVASYELGYQNGAQIARQLGVSPATVSREFKRRGARKGMSSWRSCRGARGQARCRSEGAASSSRSEGPLR